ncbi:MULTISPECIES: dihydrolipoyl dehydrogenase family protein [Metallosphaera]|uniref:Dihydrolipoamide dehydrogenase n=3 Tax=Metallosphaera TaxID=41980 RepID=A4YH04_METS5|nr:MULTISPECIES: NAD(P)/FAD-dependent oxidoreductase [Metallosphaera]ABP95706.1 dihydrolipoamide dehydrogenase [Metallosphaera sedula DSM 5348]AIM27690.1 dihydrolipoamide dehydrogenase [Metallosphaera sedula]AKV74547.1 pyridine nucleotide-disulfide oxidoreductase [Metallosphaera sedula]AKV76786.1 pyridine nucleotide-disulfide oxidoreductase [Metallosphaera sedula]AKV79037.1 pyridine nucleotide-disulfide oxidoreductase [Metallosphaera sedula]
MKFDVVIIGGGSSGYVAGSVLARHGKNVLVVEKEKFGGVCVRSGCVPSIFLYDVSFSLSRSSEIGNYKGLTIDVGARDIFASRNTLIEYLSDAGQKLVENAGGTTLIGEARVKGSVVEVNGKEIEYDNMIIASGSSPLLPRIKGVEGGITEDQAVNLDYVPKEMVVVGGGFAGVEIAQFFARLGSSVSLVTRGRILQEMSEEARKIILDSLEWDGVTVKENCEPVYQDGKLLKTTCGEFRGEVVYATGRRPNIPEDVSSVGVKVNCNGIVVDRYMRTSNPRIWAVGDVVDKERKVAHSAMMEGIVASLSILGQPVEVDYSVVPQVIYTDPQVAVVGNRRNVVKFSTFPLSASTRAIIHGIREGYVRLGFDEKDRICFGEVVSHYSEEIINIVSIAIKAGMRAKDLALVPFVHPSISESVSNTAKALFNLDVDVFKDKNGT